MKKLILFPFSVLYGLVVFVRNRLYDLNILKSTEFEVPVISIGNITVGGTGKTPHVEYLIELLKDKFEVVTLSRGYKRKTRGFFWVEENSKVADVGDEPLQMKRKFRDVSVSVCEKRVVGVDKIMRAQEIKIPDVILLDDAYQHRQITPGINILLIDYNRPIKDDMLLPAGHLRESAFQRHRASIIIFTKCPGEITPIMRRVMENGVHLKPYQEMFFTTLVYDKFLPVFSAPVLFDKSIPGKKYDILAVTGIASPLLIFKYLEGVSNRLETLQFPDHHNFTDEDIRTISSKFIAMDSANKIIVTTEKDAVRLKEMAGIDEQIKELLYYLPVKVRFLGEDGKSFNKRILGYVGENKSNRELYKRKNKRQS